MDNTDQHKSMEDKVDKMFEDLYLGKDKENPPITTRLYLMEKSVETTSKNINKAMWVLGSAILAEVANEIFRHVHFN